MKAQMQMHTGTMGEPTGNKGGLFARALTLLGAMVLLVPVQAQDAPKESTQEKVPGQVAQKKDRIEITEAHSEAVKRGLKWLAKNQNKDGSWTADVGFKLNHNYRATASGKGHVGVTSLAGMAYLAGGHFPGRGPYGKNVEACLDFVLSCAREDGYITYASTRMYSHAFATLFLAEIYGMTHREDVRAHLQKAVDFIVKSQNQEGGWRYVPLDRGSDMSIVVCQVLALRAARNIGIRVPKATIDRAIDYVVASAVTGKTQHDKHGRRYSGDLGTFHYQKEDLARTTFPLTAAGVTALHGLGVYSSDLIDHGVDFLQSRVDHFNSLYGSRGHYYFWYGHYYGVQAMYTVGGHAWLGYFRGLRTYLLDRQLADGSWPNRDGPGPAFSTAVACLILEIPYGYLPIFQR